jgi:hypothetical protein
MVMCAVDVQFEVLGAPYSLLSVSLPASSTLYTRRGTLAGLNGKIENVRWNSCEAHERVKTDIFATRLPRHSLFYSPSAALYYGFPSFTKR